MQKRRLSHKGKTPLSYGAILQETALVVKGEDEFCSARSGDLLGVACFRQLAKGVDEGENLLVGQQAEE